MRLFIPIRTFIGSTIAAGCLTTAAAQSHAVPWGISSSASSRSDVEAWFPKVKAAGVRTMRIFPEWRGFEQPAGQWNWEECDELLRQAEANGIEINPILMGSAPASKQAHLFPMNELDDWSNFVTNQGCRSLPESAAPLGSVERRQ